MILQFFQSERRVDRNRITNYMQVGLAKIDYSYPSLIGDECVPNVPLFGHGPVERLRTRGDFMDCEIGQ